MTLDENLRRAREAANLSREVLAVRAGVSSSTVARIELGGYLPRLGTLSRIAEVLNISVSDLLSIEDVPLADPPAVAAS